MNFDQLLNEPIIDIRAAKDYANCHIRGATSFPFNTIENRLHEFPTNHVALNLFGSAIELQKAVSFLEQKKYKINQALVSTPQVMNDIRALGVTENGSISKRLWNPSDVVKEFIDTYEQNKNDQKGLDLACGSGRDSVFMSMHGWAMTSVDYKQSALENLKCFSKNYEQDIKRLLINLEKNFSKLLNGQQQYDAVILVRYLHRPLLQQLKSLIRQDGYIIYQTFMEGCEAFGSPKNPRFILKKGELASLFSDFKIVLDQVVLLDDGRPTNCFIAQKV